MDNCYNSSIESIDFDINADKSFLFTNSNDFIISKKNNLDEQNYKEKNSEKEIDSSIIGNNKINNNYKNFKDFSFFNNFSTINDNNNDYYENFYN